MAPCRGQGSPEGAGFGTGGGALWSRRGSVQRAEPGEGVRLSTGDQTPRRGRGSAQGMRPHAGGGTL